jgi:hypothetical protein
MAGDAPAIASPSPCASCGGTSAIRRRGIPPVSRLSAAFPQAASRCTMAPCPTTSLNRADAGGERGGRGSNGAGGCAGLVGVHGGNGLSVGAGMDVLHALVAVVAQGSIVVVGEEPNQLVGGPRSGRPATWLSPRPSRCPSTVAWPRGRRPLRRSSWPGWNVPIGGARRCSDRLSGVEADIVGRHARSSSPCLARWASWLSGKSTARYPAAVRYQGRKVPLCGPEPSTLAMPPTMALRPIGVASTMTRPRVGSVGFDPISPRVPNSHRAGLTWVYTTAWPLGRNVSGYDELPCWVVVMRRAVRGTEEGRCGHDASSLLCSL